MAAPAQIVSIDAPMPSQINIQRREWVTTSRHYIFENINRGYDTLRRHIVGYGAETTNRLKKGLLSTFRRKDVFEVQSKVKSLENTEFPPMTQSSLSFYDDFQILSGIPVFVLRLSESSDDLIEASSSIYSPTEMAPRVDSQAALVEPSTALKCNCFSRDGSLFVTGHQDGSIRVWDAEHGKLKTTLTGPHRSPMADVAFYKTSKFLVACDFAGVMSIWDVNDEFREPVVVNCGANWERIRMPSVEGHWPKLSGEGGLLVCPIQVVLERKPSNKVGREPNEGRMFSMESIRKLDWKGGTLSRIGRHGGVFAHYCILHIFDTHADGITKPKAFGDFEGRDYSWGTHQDLPVLTRLEIPLQADSHDYALSCTEISHNTQGLLIGVSSRPDGHLIAWPDFRHADKESYRLRGMVGRWSLCDRYIITWDAPLKNRLSADVGSCRWWDVETFGLNFTPYTENGRDHPAYQVEARLEMACPSGNPIYWCDFVSLAPRTLDCEQEVGVATCSIGEHVQLVLWDCVQGIPVQTFCPGINKKDVILHTQHAWAAKWVQVKPSWGLDFISTSKDGTKLGFISVTANKGVIYDTEKRIERLWVNLSDRDGSVDASLVKHMDMIMSPRGDKFVTLCEDAVMIWLPQVLQTMESRGASWINLESSDQELKDGKLRCKFSRDGFTVGLMRLYCTVMDIWNLKTGQRIVLQQSNGQGTGTVDRPFVSREQPSDEETSFIGSPLSPVSPSSRVAAEQKGWFCQFCISRNGDQVATCMGDMSVLLWDLIASEPPIPVHIALLDSRYCAAWAVCFSEGPTGEPDYVVVCEDTGCLVWIGLHPKPRIVDRRYAGGNKRCTFSADGSRAVLMPDDIQVNVWDLIERVPLFTCTYHVWLGRAGAIPIPHNITMDGKSAFLGLDGAGAPVLCDPDTTYTELKARMEPHKPRLIPENLTVNEDLSWIVVDEFRDFDVDAPKRTRMQRMQTRESSWAGPVASSSSVRSSSSNNTLPKRRSSARVKFSGAEDSISASVSSGEPIEEPAATERYPNIRERLGNEQLWEYLKEYTPSQMEQQDAFASGKLVVQAIGGEGSSKQLWLPNLSPQRFIVISDDGTKIACMDQDDRLNIWSAHASHGCIPTSHLQLSQCPGGDMNFLERELDIYGPGIINYQDRSGLTILLFAVLKKNVQLLKTLLSWAKRNDVKISLRDELTGQSSGKALNALNLALGHRSPEVTRSIMKYLLEGVCTEVETSLILKDSLVRLSSVYPSILLRILDNNRIMMRLRELTVPEWAFARSEYKVDTRNQLMPTPSRVEEMWLQEKLVAQEGLFRKPAFKRTSAYACVMPYPDIAQVGMKGILRPLLFYRVPHHVFATWPIRCVIKLKWGIYGKRLVVEDCVHYLALLFFFTLYALLLGFLINQDEDDHRIHDAAFYKNGTVGVLAICVFLALGTLMRKLNQLHCLWDTSKWRGILYWFTDYFNLIELLCYVFIVFLVPFAHSRGPSSRILATIVAGTCILLWAKTLYYAQAFKGTGPLVIMIREIVKDIRFYLFLMFAILMGFAIAFFVLFRNDRFEDCPEEASQEENDECLEKKSEIKALFGSFDKTLITMFSMMLGEVSDVADLLFKVQTGLRIVGIVMYILYMLSVAIVLLNLLIAIMGDGFDRVKATDMSYFLKKRAQIIDDMELGLTRDRQDEISREIGTYLHVLMPKHKSEYHQHTGEWQGRMKDAQHRFKQDVVKIMQQYGDGMRDIHEQLNRLDRKVDDFMHSTQPGFPQRVASEAVSATPSRGHGGGRLMQLSDVAEHSDIDNLFGDDSDADTV